MNTETIAEVPATCTESGTAAGIQCKDCGEKISGFEVIDALGHNFVDGVCTRCSAKACKYALVDDISTLKATDTIIIVATTKDGTSYAMSNDKGTSKAPVAVKVAITDGVIATDATNILWNIVSDSNGLTIHPDGITDKWLYCTNSNDGVRVGTNANKYFTLDSTSGYLKNTATSRYLGVYTTNSDWRCYTNTTGNTANQAFSFYKLLEEPSVNDEPSVKSVSVSLNKGVTVKVKYNVPETWLTQNPDAKIVFSNGEEFAALAGEPVYSVDLKATEINNALTVKVQLSDGSTYGEEVDVSFNAYKTKIEAADCAALGISEAKYNALKALLDATLEYAKAADGEYNNLTNVFGDVEDTTVLHADENNKLFTGYAAALGEYATVYINVNTENEKFGGGIIVTVDGKELIKGKLEDYVTDGKIIIEGVYPGSFDEVIYIATGEGSTAKFTFNSYLKDLYGSSSTDNDVKNLAVATYLYGVAAEAYVAAE